MDNIFYIYVYPNLRKPGKYKYGEFQFDYEPFYIGKGSNNRLYDHLKEAKNNSGDNQDKINIINEILNAGFTIKDLRNHIIKYKTDMIETDAWDLEILMIATIGRADDKKGPLTNHSDGGEGPVGRIQSPKERESRREKFLGEKNWNFGRTGELSPSWKRKHTEDEIKKMSVGRKGKNCGGNHPNARAVIANREIYQTIKSAHEELNISRYMLLKRIDEGEEGYSYLNKEIQREVRKKQNLNLKGIRCGGLSPNARAVIIDRVKYPAIIEASRKLNIPGWIISYRLGTGKEGYSYEDETEEDREARRKANIDKKAKAVIINGEFFPTIKAASRELNINYQTLCGWIRAGKPGYTYYDEEKDGKIRMDQCLPK